MTLLLAAKLANTAVPLMFARAVDTLDLSLATPGAAVTATVTALLLGYGGARAGAVVFNELRNAVGVNCVDGIIKSNNIVTRFSLAWRSGASEPSG